MNSGPIDITQIEDLTVLYAKSMTSQISVQERSEASIRSRVRQFRNHNWSAWYGPFVPLGYNKTDDDWLEIIPEKSSDVKNLFRKFVETKSYEETARYVNEHTNLSERILSGAQIKRCLQRKVYIGEPNVNMDNDYYDEEELTEIDSDLQIIDENLYKKSKKLISIIEKRNSASAQIKDIDDHAEIVGFLSVLESSPYLALHCPECDNKMVKNGPRSLFGEKQAHNYLYKNCGRQKKYPTEKEYREMNRSE